MKFDIEEILAILLICGILPLGIVWLVSRIKMQKNKLTSEIILAAIEKNSDININEFAKSLNHKENSAVTAQERCIRRLKTGCSCLIIGIGLVVVYLNGVLSRASDALLVASIVLTGFGLGAIIAYIVGRKTIKKEEKEQ